MADDPHFVVHNHANDYVRVERCVLHHVFYAYMCVSGLRLAICIVKNHILHIKFGHTRSTLTPLDRPLNPPAEAACYWAQVRYVSVTHRSTFMNEGVTHGGSRDRYLDSLRADVKSILQLSGCWEKGPWNKKRGLVPLTLCSRNYIESM